MVTFRTVFCKARQRVLIGTISAVFGGFLLTGCGYKGPLYLPPPPDTLGEQAKQSNESNESNKTPVESPDAQSVTTDPPLEPTPMVIE